MEDVHYVQLEPERNRQAWRQARGANMRKDRWLASLIEEYSKVEPAPRPPKPEVVDTRVEVRVTVPDEVWARAKRRARSEGRDVSAALADLVAKAAGE